jgi:Holliday junction resolvasome RuvABC endonuclease subunit
MSIIGLDTGWMIGWAHGGMHREAALPERYGATDFGVRRRDAAARAEVLDLFARWLDDFARRYGAACIAVEAPILGRSAFHGNVLRVGQYTVAEVIAHRRRLRLVSVHPATLRKFWTGHGGCDNATMTAAVRRSRPHCTIKTDHEADALGLLDVARERLGADFRLTA